MKVFFDKLISLILLFPLLVFIFLLSILILVKDRFLPFFITKRVGKDGKEFVCLKLQTLTPTKDVSSYNNTIKDSQRITKLGKFLRDRGWDELPQVFNILTGQMAFVGPRPLPESQYIKLLKENASKVKLIEEWRSKRIKVLPGLSGWHQVHLTDHNIIKYDNEYLNNPDFKKDLIVLYRSILILIFGKKTFFNSDIPDTYEYKI
jgi:lipopolysaccharide/colanic/teichoic acid biosynthesis glycosyltransferase